MSLVVAGFDWDVGNRAKCQKHGVSTHQIEGLLTGPIAIVPDLAHSAAEARFKAIGRTDGDRFVLIVFTLRRRAGNRLVRPISARFMHGKEVAYYEKEITRSGQR